MIVTLKTLPMATEQEVFDQVVAHARRQRRECRQDSGNQWCQYRKGELKCFAGALIADDEYLPLMDGLSGGGWQHLVKAKTVPMNHQDLICELQSVHDMNNVCEWDNKFQALAENYSLAYTPQPITEVAHAV